MRVCQNCETQYPEHYEVCPSCKHEKSIELKTKYKYTEIENELLGEETKVLMAVSSDCNFDIE